MQIVYRSFFPFEVKIDSNRRSSMQKLLRRDYGPKVAKKKLSSWTTAGTLEEAYILLVKDGYISDQEVEEKLASLSLKDIAAIHEFFELDEDYQPTKPRHPPGDVEIRDRPSLQEIYDGIKPKPQSEACREPTLIQNKSSSKVGIQKERVSLQIESTVLEEIKLLAERDDRSISYVIRRACKEYIKKGVKRRE